jgi:hypothetical protein
MIKHIKHFFSEILGFIGVFVLLAIMTIGFALVTPFVLLHYLINKIYDIKKP